MARQPVFGGAATVLVRLGSQSVAEIREIDALHASPPNPLNLVIRCKQVPLELAVGSLALICFGSDNNSGSATDWAKGLRAIGTVTAKTGGPRWQDDWDIGLEVAVVLPQSFSARDAVIRTPDFYPSFVDMPVIGVGANSNQTVQKVETDRPSESLGGLLAALVSCYPQLQADLDAIYPALGQMVLPARQHAMRDLDQFEAPLVAIEDDRLWRLLQTRRNVVLYGPPGTGKTHAALDIEKAWRQTFGDESVLKTTFHPTYSYETFVEGFRPYYRFSPIDDDTESDTPLLFSLQNGVLKEACERAANLGPDGQVLLFIDEINRADVARVFGEFITYMEPSKRDIDFTLSQRPSATFSVPRNLSILGTMNTADKSVSLLDIALRRRFAFISMPPDPTAFERIDSWRQEIEGLPLSLLLAGLNQRLLAAGIPPDRAIGQALLAVRVDEPNPTASLLEKFELDIYPLVEEYCYFDRYRIKEILGDLVDQEGTWKTETENQWSALRDLSLSPTIGELELRDDIEDDQRNE